MRGDNLPIVDLSKYNKTGKKRNIFKLTTLLANSPQTKE